MSSLLGMQKPFAQRSNQRRRECATKACATAWVVLIVAMAALRAVGSDLSFFAVILNFNISGPDENTMNMLFCNLPDCNSSMSDHA